MGDVVPLFPKLLARKNAERLLSVPPEVLLGAGHLEYLEKCLRRVERHLERGTYPRGPRKGLPYDEHDRATKEAEARRLRAESIPGARARIAGIARQLGLGSLEPADRCPGAT